MGRHAGGEYASWRGLGSPTILFKFFVRKLRQCFNINHLHRDMHRQARVEQRCFSITLSSAILTVRPRLNEGILAENIRQERCVAPRATASADHGLSVTIILQSHLPFCREFCGCTRSRICFAHAQAPFSVSSIHYPHTNAHTHTQTHTAVQNLPAELNAKHKTLYPKP